MGFHLGDVYPSEIEKFDKPYSIEGTESMIIISSVNITIQSAIPSPGTSHYKEITLIYTKHLPTILKKNYIHEKFIWGSNAEVTLVQSLRGQCFSLGKPHKIVSLVLKITFLVTCSLS